MILVDSSVWIDHLRSTDRVLFPELDSGRVLGHPFVTGEVALGSLSSRGETLAWMQQLSQAVTATRDKRLHSIAGELGIAMPEAKNRPD